MGEDEMFGESGEDEVDEEQENIQTGIDVNPGNCQYSDDSEEEDIIQAAI